jgi:dynein heavy chain 1
MFEILLDAFISHLFTAHSFDADCSLIKNIDGKGGELCVPDGVTRDELLRWVQAIRQLQVPAWLGLPNNADKVLLTVRGGIRSCIVH